MLQVQQLIDAAIAADMSLQIKKYTKPRVEPGTSHTESRDSTTELFQNAIHVWIMQLYLKHTACKAALNKPLIRAAFKH